MPYAFLQLATNKHDDDDDNDDDDEGDDSWKR